MEALYGLLLPFLGTSLGAASVFFMKKAMSDGLQKGLTGGRRHGGKAPFVLYYNHIVAWNGQNTMFLKKICGLCRECGGCLV